MIIRRIKHTNPAPNRGRKPSTPTECANSLLNQNKTPNNPRSTSMTTNPIFMSIIRVKHLANY